MSKPYTSADELKERLSSILFEDDFPLLDRSEVERLDELSSFIKQRELALLERLERLYQQGLLDNPDDFRAAIQKEKEKLV